MKLALAAVETYQFMPDDQVQHLCLSGLLLLNDLDEQLAPYHAWCLLARSSRYAHVRRAVNHRRAGAGEPG